MRKRLLGSGGVGRAGSSSREYCCVWLERHEESALGTGSDGTHRRRGTHGRYVGRDGMGRAGAELAKESALSSIVQAGTRTQSRRRGYIEKVASMYMYCA